MNSLMSIMLQHVMAGNGFPARVPELRVSPYQPVVDDNPPLTCLGTVPRFTLF